jgi:hypothetical protein
MTIPVLATNVRKARFQSTCPTCRGPVLVGQQIARCSGGLWQHASCYLAGGGHRHYADRPGECASTEAAQ